MNLSVLALRFRPVVYMLAVVLMAFGAFSYFDLPARADPKVTIREALVITEHPGLSPLRVEKLITEPLERSIRQISEVDEIRSTSMPGKSIIHVEIDYGHPDLDALWQELRDRVDAARPQLPDGTRSPVINDDFGDVAVVTAALTSADFPKREVAEFAEHVQDRLYALDGTKRVDLLGVHAERIRIEPDDARLAELGLSTDALAAALANRNIIQPGGTLDTGERRFLVRPTGEFDSVEAVGDALISAPGAEGPVPLAELAEIRRTYVDPPSRLAYYNGKPAVILAVSMADGASVLDFGVRVKERLEAVQQTLPAGLELDLVTYQADEVRRAVYGVTANVGQTLAVVLAVVILFLGLRTGLIVGSIVPAVMLVTIAVMGFLDMSLQRMSLATLVIALGLLVDNAIVLAEDFKHRLEQGVQRDEAVRQSGGELALPLLSSTLTTILVFLPLMLAEHVSGEYTRSISLVILISLLASWLLSMTVTLLLCHRFAMPSENGGGKGQRFDPSQWLFRRMNTGYERALRRVLRHRALFLLAMVGLFATAVFGMSQAPQKFFPNSDRPQAQIYVDLPAGVSAATTDERLRRAMELLDDEERFPHIEGYAAYVGFGGPRFILPLAPIDPAPNRGFVVVNIDAPRNVGKTVEALRAALRRQAPGLSAQVTNMFLGPSDSTKIEIQAQGPDARYINAIAGRIESLLADVRGAIDIRSDWENRIERLVVEVDERRAWRAGVTSADVAASLAQYHDGRTVSHLREGSDRIPLVLRGPEAGRGDPQRLATITVNGTDGGVPLAQVAAIERTQTWSRIHREDLERTVTVQARNTRMTAEDMLPRIADELDALRDELAPGHEIEVDGVIQDSREARASLATNVPLCVGAILILLVAQFNSYRRPLLIVATIPLLLIGAVVGIYVMGAQFGFMPLLGLYALAGILVNNAIVLIDRIDIERGERPDEAFEALVSASVRRLRPIVMTTVTTVIGLLPLILSGDALFYGLASVVAFGLIVGTVLTLGVVPTLYSVVLGVRPRATQTHSAPTSRAPARQE